MAAAQRSLRSTHRVLQSVPGGRLRHTDDCNLETQSQWSDLAIARTTPALLGLYSLIVLLAQHLSGEQSLTPRTTAWYIKPEATFSDVLALVRRYLWEHTEFTHSPVQDRPVPIPENVLHGLIDLLCYAA